MPVPTDKEDHPSSVALKNEREIGSLIESQKNFDASLGSLGREMREGFVSLRNSIDHINDRVNRPPDKSMYLGMIGLLLAGVPIIATLIYFVVTSTVAPLIERLGKLEQSVQVSKDHEWDNFELLVRSDQVLLDKGLKINESETIVHSDEKAKKHKKEIP
jgi:hypothetical protein